MRKNSKKPAHHAAATGPPSHFAMPYPFRTPVSGELNYNGRPAKRSPQAMSAADTSNPTARPQSSTGWPRTRRRGPRSSPRSSATSTSLGAPRSAATSSTAASIVAWPAPRDQFGSATVRHQPARSPSASARRLAFRRLGKIAAGLGSARRSPPPAGPNRPAQPGSHQRQGPRDTRRAAHHRPTWRATARHSSSGCVPTASFHRSRAGQLADAAAGRLPRRPRAPKYILAFARRPARRPDRHEINWLSPNTSPATRRHHHPSVARRAKGLAGCGSTPTRMRRR